MAGEKRRRSYRCTVVVGRASISGFRPNCHSQKVLIFFFAISCFGGLAGYGLFVCLLSCIVSPVHVVLEGNLPWFFALSCISFAFLRENQDFHPSPHIILATTQTRAHRKWAPNTNVQSRDLALAPRCRISTLVHWLQVTNPTHAESSVR